MAERVAIFLQSSSFEPAYQCATLALTAAAMGDEVWIVLGFQPLRALASGELGAPRGEEERLAHERAAALNVPSPLAMLGQARELGARFVACDTLVQLAGAPRGQLALLHETVGLPSIWRFARTARTVTF